ncbi:protein of unknown function (plasmid) [Rhodovastum atsumiense]|uniref:GSU2403 family nucleotidyltransferase fold protein n=1 Tax=Rhodovastum atsumiense TaxID=504468 RepID=UPI002024A799|nr:GSU2403 family nucleotidyltransferase fold protein [Rhodovastum atsumiense]CAH2605498.1 protein of unknown function [Rhodovastum atsumiense]
MPALPPELQATYAELLDTLLEEASAISGIIQRGLVSKTVKGHRFWYLQYRGSDGRRHEKYIGPETPELLERVRHQQRFLAAERARRVLVRALVGGRAVPQVPVDIGRVLTLLSENGLFRDGAVLFGTLALRAYGPMLGMSLSNAMLVDEKPGARSFRVISIAVEGMVPPVLDLLKTIDPAFRLADPPHVPPDTYVSAAKRLKVEFVIPLPAHAPGAPARRLLGYLLCEKQPGVILCTSGVLVNVPDPARFAWWRLLASGRRMPQSVLHAQAAMLFDALVRENPDAVVTTWHELRHDGRDQWQTAALAMLHKLPQPVRDAVLTLIGRKPE